MYLVKRVASFDYRETSLKLTLERALVQANPPDPGPKPATLLHILHNTHIWITIKFCVKISTRNEDMN